MNNLKRILFVDDEPNILAGLQNMLRKHRRQWDMVFVPGGQAALGELEKGRFDVIVSDMRMPEMDGAVLLQEVREKHPSVARIVLSGHAERIAVVRALPVAHQFLSKPCDAETLQVVIERACELQTLLGDEIIREAVGKLDKLPSVPNTYWELKQAILDPDIGIQDIAKIVEKDAAMSIKVLQLVNSAYFGAARQRASVSQAVSLLGIELLKGLVLTAHVFAAFDGASIPGFSLEAVQQSSLLTARLCKRFLSEMQNTERTLATAEKQFTIEEAFTAGLVHDIGKIMLALGVPERFAEVVRITQEGKRPFHIVEKELIGVTHAEVGAYLLGVWGLPFPIVEAVAYHHNPGKLPHASFDVLAAVHVADALIDRASATGDIGTEESKLDLTFLERIGVIDQLPKWHAMAKEEARDSAR